ncbi:MAG: hypothetical protein II499_03625 [Firmicutes bacterium]|nr:hypothetical protein [Bacillota bacterium]MBQ2455162.1 hypothetical protein [Bacillota bacterium]
MTSGLRSRKFLALLMAALIIVMTSACGTKTAKEPDEIILNVFASNNSVYAVANLVDSYKSMSSYAAVRVTYDEPSMLAAKIEAGYDCDIFICEDEACMDWLDATKDKEVNPNGNDCLAEGTRSAVFKGTPEGAEEEMTFSAAVIKTTAQEKEAGKFMSFIESENADKVYDASGFERITE